MSETEKLMILGKMSALLAHEIRNPLAGITAVTQVLEGKIDKDDPRRKYVSLILKEIDRVNKIVHDLLDFTRDSRPYFVQSIITTLADRAISSLASDIENKGIRIEKQYAAGNLSVEADQEKIERVFKNIVVNAIEAMDSGGTLTIIAEETEEAGSRRRGVKVSLSDTGRGIDVADLNELFSPFYTTKSKGTGLGLAVSHKVIEDHGGEIKITRNQDNGLTLTIFLPSEQPNEKKLQTKK